ncbi:MAG: 16S rRNA (uracil(1498)-N(3))-methyltransferase [Proteobacteria bacterium]|nr:16S rRNA (uracil(1498)-N(3))-methyltransferase [Pseudomonadota bacterium]
MKSRRAYLEQLLYVGESVLLDGDKAHYLARVLRLRQGHSIELFNGDGYNYAGEIIACSKKTVELKINSQEPGLTASNIKIKLVQALSRGERLDYSLQKATELGVDSIQLLLSERVELHLDEKRLERRMRHWQQVIISACEQCGRSDVPRLSQPVELATYLATENISNGVVLDPEAEQGISGVNINPDSVDLLVGPEGGFSTVEMERLLAANVQAMRLGPRVLRTETAGPAAIAVLQQYYGDLN